jgi:radical SAM superfamily enzyme YgiQ (UPF0313 family)
MSGRILLFFSGKETVQKNVPPPLSILAIAAPLLEAGFEVDLLDSRVTPFEEKDLSPYGVAGISSVSGRNMAPAIRFARKVRRERPEVPIVWGGIHVSALPEESLRSDLVDVVVMREGENSFLELVRRVARGSRDFSSIPGVAFRSGKGIVLNGAGELLDVTRLQPTPYHMLNAGRYGLGEHVSLITSRGCPHTCAFCYNKRHNLSRWRALPADRVLEDLARVVREYSPKGISFSDDNFFVSRDRVAQISEGILRKGYSIHWGASCRSDYLAGYDDSFLDLLVRSGLRTINLGIESGSQRMLEEWCGNKSVRDHYLAMEKMRRFPVTCSASFIMGYPGETDMDLQETFRMVRDLKRINPRFQVAWMNIIFPFPDTDLYFRFQEYGFVPPSSLEAWSKVSLHDKQFVPWCNGRGERLDNIHKLSVWCYLGEGLGIRKALKRRGWKAKAAHLTANLSSVVRFRTGYFGSPLDIRLLHSSFKSFSDFELPD